MVEHQLPKLRVAGSTPVSRSKEGRSFTTSFFFLSGKDKKIDAEDRPEPSGFPAQIESRSWVKICIKVKASSDGKAFFASIKVIRSEGTL